MTTRSRIAILSACAAAVLGLATVSTSYAADAPATQPAATQHTVKKTAKHHVKAKAPHHKTARTHHKAPKAKTPKAQS